LGEPGGLRLATSLANGFDLRAPAIAAEDGISFLNIHAGLSGLNLLGAL